MQIVSAFPILWQIDHVVEKDSKDCLMRQEVLQGPRSLPTKPDDT